MDFLRLVANRENLAILSALAVGPEYPRRLAARLRHRETHVAQRLRTLERAGLVQGSWAREDGKNVKLYTLKTRAFTIAIDQQGYQLQASALEVAREPSSLERVPPRCPIFGREQELARLSKPGPRFSMIVGLPGMGKTSLGTELAYRHGVERVVWHTFTPFDSAWRLLGLARQWLAFLDPVGGEQYQRAKWDLADLLDRVTDGLSRHATLIILDDYQKVRDDSIHEIVRRWQRTLMGVRVVVLSRDRPPFDLDTSTQLLMLPALTPAASLRLLREYGLNASPEDLRRLDRALGGHPLSLRLYAQQPGSLPGNAQTAIEDVGREAFNALDGNSQQVLLAMAAVRRPLALEGTRFITGMKDPSLPLANLERRAMIRSQGHAYQIHDVLRESLSSAVESHPEIHRRATALFLPSEHHDDIVEALYHATQAGDWSVAGNLLERGLETERDMPSSSANARVFLESLDKIPADKLDARHRAIYHRSHALALLGTAKTTAVIRELETARRIAESLGELRLLSWILSPLGYYLGNTGRMEAAEDVLVQNLRLVESQGGPADKADALFMLALLYDRQGNHGRARGYWRLALREARRTGNERMVAEFLTWHVAFPSNWQSMLPRLRRWRADFRAWGMPRQVADMDILAGEILCRTERYRPVHRESDLRKAIALLERAIRGCDAIGNRYEWLYARSWLALAWCLAEKYEKAVHEAEATLETDRKVGPSHCAILCHQVMSRVLWHRGDLDGARNHTDEAVRLARRLRCGCVGISLLERAVQEEASRGETASVGLLDLAITETVRAGRPDEVRYARRLAHQHRLGLPAERREIGTESKQADAPPDRQPEEIPPRLRGQQSVRIG